MDWIPAPASTPPDGIGLDGAMLIVPETAPMSLPVLWISKLVGPVPLRSVPTPVPVELTNVVLAVFAPKSVKVAL
jgi:hypothetical protein